jgi:hypothetical protein
MSQARGRCLGTLRPCEAPGFGALSGLRTETFRQCEACGCTFPPEGGEAACPCEQFEGRPGLWLVPGGPGDGDGGSASR